MSHKRTIHRIIIDGDEWFYMDSVRSALGPDVTSSVNVSFGDNQTRVVDLYLDDVCEAYDIPIISASRLALYLLRAHQMGGQENISDTLKEKDIEINDIGIGISDGYEEGRWQVHFLDEYTLKFLDNKFKDIFAATDIYEASDHVKELDTLLGNKYNWVHALLTVFSLSRIKLSEEEVYIWFKKEGYKKLGDGWKIVEKKNNMLHRPDFWVSNGNETIPIECKLREFGALALRQLQRYMEFYKCERGIAVADKVVVELPDNIIFIKHPLITIRGAQ